MKTILVTGAAGFIGAHLTQRLTAQGIRVVGLDNINDYYDPQLKRARMAALAEGELFVHENLEMADRQAMENLFSRYRFDAVVNLAAQAGVRYSLINPHSYVDTNIVGFVEYIGRVSAWRRQAPGLRVFKLCVRGKHQYAVFRS